VGATVCSISFGPVMYEISLIESAVVVTYHKTKTFVKNKKYFSGQLNSTFSAIYVCFFFKVSQTVFNVDEHGTHLCISLWNCKPHPFSAYMFHQ
jgi:hypothetical protein